MVASAPDNNSGLYEQDIAYSGGQLFVSDANLPDFEGGTNVIDVYDAATLRLPADDAGGRRTASPPAWRRATGQSSDWYQFGVTAGETITLSTTTPGGPPGEFVNGLNPEINIYAPDGTFVGSNAGGAGDGRNDLFTLHGRRVGRLPRPGDSRPTRPAWASTP